MCVAGNWHWLLTGSSVELLARGPCTWLQGHRSPRVTRVLAVGLSVDSSRKKRHEGAGEK